MEAANATGNAILDNGEPLIHVRQAFNALGLRVPPATLTRWTLRGVRGVKLEVVRVGRKVYTSEDAARRFLAASSEASPTAPRREVGRKPKVETPRKARERSISAARERCKALGVKIEGRPGPSS